jgi:hypothetical protein
MHLDPREPAVTAPEPAPAEPTAPAPQDDRRRRQVLIGRRVFLGFTGLTLLLLIVGAIAAGGSAPAHSQIPAADTTPPPSPVAEADHQAQDAALAAFRAASPDMTSCTDDLGKVDADRKLALQQLKERTAYGFNSLGPDAQQMVVDCAPLATAFAAMDVGDNTLAQDARNHWHSAILELMRYAQDYAAGAGDLQNGQFDAAISRFDDAVKAMGDATADMHTGNQDLGVDGTSD